MFTSTVNDDPEVEGIHRSMGDRGGHETARALEQIGTNWDKQCESIQRAESIAINIRKTALTTYNHLPE